jgi:hypothetical protein
MAGCAAVEQRATSGRHEQTFGAPLEEPDGEKNAAAEARRDAFRFAHVDRVHTALKPCEPAVPWIFPFPDFGG